MIRKIKAVMIHILKKSSMSWNSSNGMEKCNRKSTENTVYFDPKTKGMTKISCANANGNNEQWKIRALIPIPTVHTHLSASCYGNLEVGNISEQL